MKRRIVVWGTSGHALVVADILRLTGDAEVLGFLDDRVDGERVGEVLGLPVLGGRAQLPGLKGMGATHIVLAFGDCGGRRRLAPLVDQAGLEFATAIHPKATVAAGTVIGAGTVIVAGVVVNPGVRIGRNAILNTCSSVDHECVLGEAVHIGPGVHLGGRVIVGDAAWIGIGAIIRDRIQIGAGSIIGAGAVITKDVPAGVVAYGVPGRVVRKVEERPT